MTFNWRVAASATGLLIAAGAVVGGVALAEPSTPAHHAPAAVQTTASTPAPTPTVAATTSAATATTAPAVSPSTHHVVVQPKETTVSEPSVSESVPVQRDPVTSDSAGRAGNAPPPPPVSTPPQQLPTMTVPDNAPEPSDTPTN